ncbi:MAG: coproporphyrinogen III oxidase family protein, partial [Rikenellaceae bacterium]
EAVASEAGFEHYEISNFAKKGFRAIHNSNYWQGKVYVGFGPSAHSFDGRCRRWNISNNTKYVSEGGFEEEHLTDTDIYNETVMTRLRTSEGVLVESLKAPYREYFLEESKRYIAAGLLSQNDGRVFIETRNFLVSDAIIESLFYIT